MGKKRKKKANENQKMLVKKLFTIQRLLSFAGKKMRSEIAPCCVTNLEKKGLFSLEAHVLGKPMADLRNEIINKTLQ